MRVSTASGRPRRRCRKMRRRPRDQRLPRCRLRRRLADAPGQRRSSPWREEERRRANRGKGKGTGKPERGAKGSAKAAAADAGHATAGVSSERWSRAEPLRLGQAESAECVRLFSPRQVSSGETSRKREEPVDRTGSTLPRRNEAGRKAPGLAYPIEGNGGGAARSVPKNVISPHKRRVHAMAAIRMKQAPQIG